MERDERLRNGATDAVRMSEDEEKEERLHFQKVANAFRNYRAHAIKRLNKTRRYIDQMNDSHQLKLKEYRNCLNGIEDCVEENAKFMQLVYANAACTGVFENADYRTDSVEQQLVDKVTPTELDMDKTHSVLKQVVREWSSVGEFERKDSVDRVMRELDEHFANVRSKADVKVLVPGAGLGRLVYEICRHGYSCQGNEYSMFMILASNFLINRCCQVDAHSIYPWIHSGINHLSFADQTAAVKFPDANPQDIPQGVDFSMAAGSFLDVYQQPESWDGIVTNFFIDTAHNIVEYVEKIHAILKSDGIWINYG